MPSIDAQLLSGDGARVSACTTALHLRLQMYPCTELGPKSGLEHPTYDLL